MTRFATGVDTAGVVPAVSALIESTSEITERDCTALVGDSADPREITALSETLESWRIDEPRVDDTLRLSADLARLRVRTRRGVHAEITLRCGNGGVLAGAHVHAPPLFTVGVSPRDADAVESALSVLGSDTVVCARGRAGLRHSDVSMAGSSLMKVFVVDGVLAAVDRGLVGLADTVTVTADDVVPLSAGLTTRHVGEAVTVGELCVLAARLSDNTATDLLLRRLAEIGRPVVAGERVLTSCGRIISAAWGCEPGLRRRSATQCRHADGLDWFLSLPDVADAFERIAHHPHHPWRRDAGRSELLQKGGQAAGVLAGAWSWSIPGDPGRSFLGAICNDDRPFGGVDTRYFHACLESALVQSGVPPADLALSHNRFHDAITKGLRR